MSVLPLLLLALASLELFFLIYAAIQDFSAYVLSPPRHYARKRTPHELVFPKYEHQLYMQQLKKRRQLRQRFFHLKTRRKIK